MQMIKFKLEAQCMTTCFKFSLNFYRGIKFSHSTFSNKSMVRLFKNIISFWFECGQQKIQPVRLKPSAALIKSNKWSVLTLQTEVTRRTSKLNHVSYRTCCIELSIEHFLSTEMYQNLVKQGSMDKHHFVRHYEVLPGLYLIIDNVLDVCQLQSGTQNSSYSGTLFDSRGHLNLLEIDNYLLRPLSYMPYIPDQTNCQQPN